MLTIALPKGRLADDALLWLDRAGWPLPVSDNGRRLVIPSTDGSLNYVLAKPMDVPVFVEQGAADIGIAGLDVLRERDADVFEPMRLALWPLPTLCCCPGRSSRPALAP